MKKAIAVMFVLMIATWLPACKEESFTGSSNSKERNGKNSQDANSVDEQNRKDNGKGDSDGDDGQDGKDGKDDGDDSKGDADGDDSNSNGEIETGADTATGGGIETNEDKIKRKLPTFGMLVNDLTCGMCHLKINGNVASTRGVHELESGSASTINGTWFGAAEINIKSQVSASGGFKENYSGVEVPKKFPELDLSSGTIKGVLKGKEKTVKNSYKGNLVITGTQSNPIEISGDVLIKGDLVIKGFYKGRGNIYVEGNVYIPFDLRAKTSAFPFSESENEAMSRAKKLVKSDTTDALGIGTLKSIFLGDLGHEQPAFHPFGTFTIYTGPKTPSDKKEGPLGVLGVYNWISGGKDGYRALYENGYNCLTNSNSQRGSFNVVEAFLYAKNTIGGVARTNTFAINGGIIADAFHVIARRSKDYFVFPENAKGCPQTAHPVHKMTMGYNYVNYDWRIKAGMRILNRLDFGH